MKNSRSVFIKNNKKLFDYTWRQEWISPFESPWSIFEKFRMMNSITSKEFLKYFGASFLQRAKTILECHRQLYNLESLDQTVLNQIFKHPVVEQNKIDLYTISKSNSSTNQKYFREKLWFCPVCIKEGFHSTLHQFIFIQNCPYHGIPLNYTCPKCNLPQSYTIGSKVELIPFSCACQYNFLDKDLHLGKFKRFEINQIRDGILWSWLNNKKVNLDDFIFSGQVTLEDETKFRHTIRDLIDILNPPLTGKDSKLIAIYSNKNIGIIKSPLQQKEEKLNCPIRRSDNLTGWGVERLKSVEDEIRTLSDNIFNSIARKLRKTIIKRHKHCLKDLTRNKEEIPRERVCPNAYAYALWRKKSQRFTSLKHVDNFGTTPFFREYREDFFLPIISNTNLIIEIKRR